jgi:lysophospholipase L1-like esterase
MTRIRARAPVPTIPTLLAGAALLWSLAMIGCQGGTDAVQPTGSGGTSTVSGSGGMRTGGTSGSTGGSSTATGTGGAGSGGAQGGSGGSTGGALGSGGSVGRDGSTSSGGSPMGGSSGNGGNATDAGRDAGGGSAGGALSNGGAGSGGSSGSGGSRAGGSGSGGGLGQGGATSAPDAGRGGSGGGDGAAAGGSGGGNASFDPCPASEPCKIMPLGDSITEGTGFAGGYRGKLYTKAVANGKNITFVGSLKTNPPTGITGFPTSHEGHFAWTIQQIDDIIPTPTLNVSPHIVLLHIGTNDINQKLSGAPTRLKSLITQIVTAVPGALVVVAQVIPISGSTSAVQAYNAEIPAIVQEQASGGKHVILVDQYTGFPTSELGDGVHPNEAGYTRMADTWFAAIKSYLH